MRIRHATERDIPEITRIYGFYVTHSDYTFDTSIPSQEYLLDQIHESMRKHAYLVLEDNQGLKGYSYTGIYRKKAAYDWICEIGIYMDKDHKGKGHGKMLYTTLMDLAALQGYRTLLAGITSPNERSERFHRSLGFDPIWTYDHIGFKNGAWKDVVWWRKDIQQRGSAPSPIRPISDIEPEALRAIGLHLEDQ